MLDKLRQFISDVISPAGETHRHFDETDFRLAATALLIHVISIDGAPSDAEKKKLRACWSIASSSTRAPLIC